MFKILGMKNSVTVSVECVCSLLLYPRKFCVNFLCSLALFSIDILLSFLILIVHLFIYWSFLLLANEKSHIILRCFQHEKILGYLYEKIVEKIILDLIPLKVFVGRSVGRSVDWCVYCKLSLHCLARAFTKKSQKFNSNKYFVHD